MSPTKRRRLAVHSCLRSRSAWPSVRDARDYVTRLTGRVWSLETIRRDLNRAGSAMGVGA